MVTRRHNRRVHLGNTKGNGFTFGGHQDDFLVDFDSLFETEQTGDHEFGAVADGVHGAVFDDDAFVGGEEGFEGADDAAQVGF